MKSKTKKMLQRISSFICVLAMVVANIATLITPAVKAYATSDSSNTVWIVGDSTVSSFNDAYYYPRYGWGTQIGEYLDGTYDVKNLALSGRSSVSFTKEDNYTTLVNEMKSGDYLLVGFGHNDEKAGDGLFSSGSGDYKTPGTFGYSLYENYIKPANEKGVTVILCTPIVRRTTEDSFSDSQLHKTENGDYAQAIRDLSANLKNDLGLDVPIVDMTSKTQALYESLGASKTLYLHAWTSDKETSVDNTHTNIYGGMYNAWMITQEIKAQNIAGIAEHIKTTAAPVKAEVLKSNPDYVPATYTPVADDEKSSVWKNAGIWRGTVFGKGITPDTGKFTLNGSSDGTSVNMAVKNKGKISSSEDDIAMYFYKVPSGSSFTLSATVKVNSINAAGATNPNQISFGLMARDDIYLDKNMATAVSSDYVAAAPYDINADKSSTTCCFAKKSNTIIKGSPFTRGEEVKEGGTYDLKIESTGDGYACSIGDQRIVGGFDFQLTQVDPDNVYVGMFAARDVDVSFSDIKLVVDGQTICGSDKVYLSDDFSVSPGKEYSSTYTKGTALSDEDLKLTSGGAVKLSAADYNDTSYGILVKKDSTMDINIPAGAGAKVTFQGSARYSKDGHITAASTDSNGKFDVENGIYSNRPSGVDDRGNVTIEYSGKEKATLTLAFDADTFLDNLSIELLEEPKYLTEDYSFDPGTLQGYAQNDLLGKSDLKLGTDGEIKLSAMAKYSNANYGLYLPKGTYLNVNVPRGAVIKYKGSAAYPANGGTISVKSTDESGSFDNTSYSTKPSEEHGYVTIDYTGNEEAILTFTFDADTYFGEFSIELKEPYVAPSDKKIDVWDFGAKEEDSSKYNNNITADIWNKAGIVGTDGKFSTGSPYSFGDLKINYNVNSDRFYTDNSELKNNAGGSATYKYTSIGYKDGYISQGLWYCNGTGGASRRYFELANVKSGDTVRVYMGSSTVASTVTFTDGSQSDTQNIAVGGNILSFVADNNGTYKVYEAGTGKPIYSRVVRIPGVTVTGRIDTGSYSLSEDYNIVFTDVDTDKKYTATVNREDNTYNINLPVDKKFSANLTGAGAYGFTTDSKNIDVATDDVFTGKTCDFVVEEKSTYKFTGKITGFTADDNNKADNIIIKMVCLKDSTVEPVSLEINKEDYTFSADLLPGIEYTAQLSGVNDYEIVSGDVINDSAAHNSDITVAKKSVYKATGSFEGLDNGEVVDSLIFENIEDGYTYKAALKSNGYEVSLRDGSYLAKATVKDYDMGTHVVIDGKDVTKNLLFVSTKKKDPLTRVSDIYVGYDDKENNYSTVKEAVEACGRMNPTSEDERITVHIAPGTYREQIRISTPYISFVNDTPDKEVLITWYYGIGYLYYSVDKSGFYNKANAFDKFARLLPTRWGSTVQIKSTAHDFRASGITFESSFNRYITDEEIEDGVTLDTSMEKNNTTTVRQYGVDVMAKSATERAAAIAVESNQTEFYNCSFLSSQDTLYTNEGNKIYFKNCVIEGETDYIFGGGNVIFDGCQLAWCGYSSGETGGYITAQKSNINSELYLFRNCSVVSGDLVKQGKTKVAAGYLGRPWGGVNAKVAFLNTRLESDNMIVDAGWGNMSGVKPQDAKFYEYNTTYMDGSKVDVSKRTNSQMTQEEAAAYTTESMFGSWKPACYTEEENNVEIKGQVSVTDNGDLNTPYPGHTLTVHYSLGEANDANDNSIVQWYIVDGNNEELVKTSNAVTDKTFKIPSSAIGKKIKVKVTPVTFSGNTGDAAEYIVEESVRDGYEDPSAGSGDIEVGNGINIYLAGDSTVRDYSASGLNSSGKTRDEGAWGEFLQMFFDSSKVKIQNYANGGRSARTFINEGTLDKIAANIKEGDYLFVQFGHNDSWNNGGYPDRYVPLGIADENGIYPVTEGTKDSNGNYPNGGSGTYKWFLKQYIDVAKSKGAIPVLVTPVSRTNFDSSGNITPHHDDKDTKNNAYVEAVKQLADEEDVLLIDAFEMTKSMYEAAYKADTDAANKVSPLVNSTMYYDIANNKVDKTHSNKLGGFITAQLFVKEIQRQNLNIASAVTIPSKTAGIDSNSNQVFFIDKDSKFTAYVRDDSNKYKTVSDYWTKLGNDYISDIKQAMSSEEDKPESVNVTWAFAQRGTQSDKLSVDSSLFTTEHKLTFTTGTAGKLANTGQTGAAFYYAKIKSTESNGTLRATFHVSKAASKLDNQAGMGIMVMDSLAGDDVKNTSADYLNQAEISALLKNESTGTRIPGMRTYLGNTDLTGKTNASGTCDVTNYFDANATVADVGNVTSLYYNFEMVKDCNGYTFNWYNDDWSEIKGTYTLYNPSKLLKQDKDYVYVGFYATRAGKVEVTNISTEFHKPTKEELAAVDTTKWVDYDTANVKTFNGTSTADEDYTYRFTSNVTGKLTVKDDKGNTYISDKDITSGETVKFNISEYNVKLADGDTTFTTTVTPAENSFDFDTMQKKYDDRLLLLDYSPIVVKDTVTKAALNAEDGVVYVGPAGTSDGDGTKNNPYDLQTALKFAKAGQTIIMLDGTYEAKSVIEIPFSVSGTEDNMITLKAENTGKAIIDGSNIVSSSKESVLFVKGSYWHIYGINVVNAADGYKGVHISGNHNVIEMCEMYDNGSTGLQISYSGGEPKEWWPAYNTILNCTSYYNCDSAQNDADGFAAKLSVGEGNVFDGCVSYNNADDGYDLYAKEKAGYGPIEAVVIKNSLAYNNGTLKDGSFSKASANGFKLGGEGLTGKHQLINCVSWNNGGSGIMSNNGPDCQVYNCISVDNGLFSRTGGTADRNNYQLTPKNGDKYTGKTAYIIKNSLGFYTEAITNFGTMAADKFTLVGGQSEDEIYTENNYFSIDKSTLKSVNSKGKEVTKDWFKSVDYANITPTRNTDGSIDMHGLFELTDNAPEGVGAVISKTEDNICKEHKWDAGVVTKEATCTEAGEITYTCEVCKETKTETIAAKGHTYSTEWTIDKEATCTEAGSKSHHCTECDAKTDETEIAAKGHTWDAGVVTKEATCTEAGEKTYTCEVCKETKTEAIAAKGHTWDAGKVTKEATCTEAGEKIYTCEVCKETKTETIAAKGHTYSTEWTIDKEATCTEAGSKSHHCTECDAKTDETEIAAKGHTWDAGKVTKEATCTEAGEKTYTCEVCKETKTEAIAAKGHTYSTEWTVDKEATCTEAGSKSHHCTECDAKTDETEIAAKGHTWDAGKVTKEATCTEAGEKTYTCEVCKETKTEAIEAKGHTWDAGVVTKEATCTEAGEKTYTCEVCKETKTETIAAKGHTYSTEWTVDKEATCTEAGSKSHHCTECDAKTDETEIAAKGHTWDAGVVTKEATCTEAGEKTYTCEVCKETKTEAIAAKGHTYSTEWTVDKEATTTEAGSKSHHCTVCGDKADITEIPKIEEEKPDDNKTQVDVSVDKGDNTPDMGLTGTKDEIIDSIFTDEEKKNTNGKNVEVILSVANVNDNVTDDDRKLIDSVLTPSQKTGIILDITLNVKVDNESKQMYETNKEITISTELPENLINKDTSVDRKYKVIRIHNGKTDILNAEYDAVTNKLTFATDKFSTYVIVYEDTVKDTTGETKPDQNGNTTDSSENTNVTENVTDVSSETSAKTGDTAVSMELLILVLLLSGGCAVSTFLKRRKYM